MFEDLGTSWHWKALWVPNRRLSCFLLSWLLGLPRLAVGALQPSQSLGLLGPLSCSTCQGTQGSFPSSSGRRRRAESFPVPAELGHMGRERIKRDWLCFPELMVSVCRGSVNKIKQQNSRMQHNHPNDPQMSWGQVCNLLL